MNENVGEEITRMLGFNHLILDGSLDTSSLEVYGRDCRAYLRFAETREAALTPGMLASWMAYLTTTVAYSPSTINRMATAIRRLMHEAGIRGFIDQAIAEGFQRMSGVPTIAFKTTHLPSHAADIEPEKIQHMAEAFSGEGLIALRNHALLHTLASSGLRVETCRLLKLEQLKHGAVHDSVEVRRPRDPHLCSIPLSQEASITIQNWLAARPIVSSYLFTRFDGKSNKESRLTIHPLSGVAVRAIIRQYGTAIGIPDLRPSDLRRYVGKRLAQQDVHLAQLVLGYKSLATVYNSCFPDEIELEPGITENLY